MVNRNSRWFEKKFFFTGVMVLLFVLITMSAFASEPDIGTASNFANGGLDIASSASPSVAQPWIGLARGITNTSLDGAQGQGGSLPQPPNSSGLNGGLPMPGGQGQGGELPQPPNSSGLNGGLPMPGGQGQGGELPQPPNLPGLNGDLLGGQAPAQEGIQTGRNFASGGLDIAESVAPESAEGPLAIGRDFTNGGLDIAQGATENSTTIGNVMPMEDVGNPLGSNTSLDGDSSMTQMQSTEGLWQNIMSIFSGLSSGLF